MIGQATIHTPVLQEPADRARVSGLPRRRGVPRRRVRAAGRRDHARPGRQDADQKRRSPTRSSNPRPTRRSRCLKRCCPTGPHSALTTNLPEKAKFNLCYEQPVDADGNRRPERRGAQAEHEDRAQGCKKVKAAGPLSRAQLLKRALATCRKQHSHSKAKRQACERRGANATPQRKAAHKPHKVHAHR